MPTLSLVRGSGEVAAAVAVDGVVRAALRRALVTGSPGRGRSSDVLDQLIAEVCQLAGVDLRALDRVVRIGGKESEDGRKALPHLTALPNANETLVAPVDALLSLVRAAAPEDAALVVVEPNMCVGLAPGQSGHQARQFFHGVQTVVAAARTLAIALGTSGDDPFGELAVQAEGSQGDEVADFGCVLGLTSEPSFECSMHQLGLTIDAAQGSCGGELANLRSMHTAVQRLRAGLAIGFFRRFSELIVDLAESWRRSTHAECVAVGGGLLGTVELATLVRRNLERGSVVPAVDELGAALGGALGAQRPTLPAHLALGPRFDEQQVKEVIENCRLEYVYEPDWSRLFTRVSRWISAGSTVAWFQGSLDFSRQSLGSRSILADPANRYARENMNVYLLDRPLRSRLPVSLAPSAARDSLASEVTSPLTFVLATVNPAARSALTAGLDAESRGLVHVPSAAGSPEFVGLLEAHRALTGVPGLLNVTLEAASGQLAETPRDAIRSAFSSAVDVLVMSRFLIGKDYWLMRQHRD